MKKIGIFLSSAPNHGGVYQYCLTILDALAELPKHEYRIIAAFSEPQWEVVLASYPFDAILVKTGFFSKVAGRLWRELWLPNGIWRKINPLFHPVARSLLLQECDIWIFPSQDSWTYQFGIKFIASIHDLMHRYERVFPEVGTRAEFRRREYLYKNIVKYSSGIFVDSDTGRQQVIESYQAPHNKVHTLPYIAPNYIREPIRQHCSIQHKLPEKFLFYPAQFWEHKNHARLIQAVHKLQERLPDIQIVLVGSPKNCFKKVNQLVLELRLEEKIHFLGYVPNEDLRYLYSKAHGLIMPTFFGPTNIPPLEALETNCPIAISEIYGMKDQIGAAAIYFNPSSVAEISEAIFRLWTDQTLRQLLINEGARKRVEHSKENFNKRFRLLLEKVIND